METLGNNTGEENAFTNEFVGKDGDSRDFNEDKEKPNKVALEAKRDEYIKLATEKVLKGELFGLIKHNFKSAEDFVEEVVKQLYKDHGYDALGVGLTSLAKGGEKEADLAVELEDETYTHKAIAKVAQGIEEVPFAIKDELKEKYIVPGE